MPAAMWRMIGLAVGIAIFSAQPSLGGWKEAMAGYDRQDYVTEVFPCPDSPIITKLSSGEEATCSE